MIVFNRSNLGCFLLQYCAGTCLLDCWTSTKVLSSMTDCLNQYSFRTDWEKNSYTGILMTSSPAHFLLPVEIYCWASLVNISFQNCCLIFFSFCDFCLLKIFSIYFDTIIVFSFISLSIIYFSSLIILIVITFKSFHIKCNIFSQQYMLPFYDVWIIVCFFVFLTIFFCWKQDILGNTLYQFPVLVSPLWDLVFLMLVCLVTGWLVLVHSLPLIP